MNQDPHNALRCSQFEALLADALDDADTDIGDAGTREAGVEMLPRLPNDVRQAFLAHRQDCAVCGPLFAEAQRGMRLLRSLDEVEPPKNLVHNILAATSHVEAAGERAAGREPGWLTRTQHWLRPAFSGMLHSRFAASFAMAFFSVSLTLSLAGVDVGGILKAAISHPSAVPRTVVLQYTQVEAKVTSYYENMRVVYEWESRVQQLRKAVTPQNNNTNESKPDQQNQNRPAPTSRPEQEENSKHESYTGVIAASILQTRGAHL